MKMKSFTSALLITLMLIPIANASWVDVHQKQNSSWNISKSAEATVTDPSVVFDGMGSGSGDPLIMRTYTCFNGSTPTVGAFIEIDFTLSTNLTSQPFNIIFELQFVPQAEATDAYFASFLLNTITQNYDLMTNTTSTGGQQNNISRSSSFMDDAGNIYLRLRTAHSIEDCDAYALARAYEFDIYADPASAPSNDNDGDGVLNSQDFCADGENNWTSSPSTDHDSDGCRDESEDNDDDNDGIDDVIDDCPAGSLFDSTVLTDYDSDGCNDSNEDTDDDNDEVMDNDDSCKTGEINFSGSDLDGDGCEDESEDFDDDGDGVEDISDSCLNGTLGWTSNSENDHDADGCHDISEDADDDGDSILDVDDQCNPSISSWVSSSSTDYDGDGCRDEGEDLDDDNDNINDIVDDCPTGSLFDSTVLTDHDSDGCLDADEDNDDDNDGVLDDDDGCKVGEINFQGEDHDGDGCEDNTEDQDDDGDGINDTEGDLCPKGYTGWHSDNSTDINNNGCKDGTAEDDLDEDGVYFPEDLCPKPGPINNSGCPIEEEIIPPEEEENIPENNSEDKIKTEKTSPESDGIIQYIEDNPTAIALGGSALIGIAIAIAYLLGLIGGVSASIINEPDPTSVEIVVLTKKLEGDLSSEKLKPLFQRNEKLKQSMNQINELLKNHFIYHPDISIAAPENIIEKIAKQIIIVEGAPPLLRSLTTSVARIQNKRMIKEVKRCKEITNKGSIGLSGSTILHRLNSKKGWPKRIRTKLGIGDLYQRLIIIITRWNNIIHAEDEVKGYTMNELEEHLDVLTEYVTIACISNSN